MPTWHPGGSAATARGPTDQSAPTTELTTPLAVFFSSPSRWAAQENQVGFGFFSPDSQHTGRGVCFLSSLSSRSPASKFLRKTKFHLLAIAAALLKVSFPPGIGRRFPVLSGLPVKGLSSCKH
ncbi:hypothetical protein EJB05_00069, partial [Eragrostis curvula]